MEGVWRTRVGYAGGSSSDPTYRRMGDHTECIQLEYDPRTIAYEELVDAFFGMHDASRPAYSVQYASLVLTHDEAQAAAALEACGRWTGAYGRSVLTQVRPLERFYPAEDYHQKYGLRADRTLLAEMRKNLHSETALRESTAAMRLNGFAYQGGRASLLAAEIDSYGLTEAGALHLRGLVGRR